MARKMYFLNKKKREKRNKKRNNRRGMREDDSRMNKTREERVEENRKQMEKNKYEAKKLRKQKDFAMKEKLNDRCGSDQDFKMLHDQALLICESIARILYPWDSDSEFEALDEFSYIVRIKNKLRKEVLVPLRNALMLPEVYMSAKELSSITYERVASIAMKNYTDIFLHRDNERFRSYLEKVKLGDAKISAGPLLPHEIISSFQRGSGGGMVAELQWKRMVDDMLKEGKLANCIAVCDVSGSMHGTPMEVCVALGLLVSELSEEPWKGHVITFSESPELHLVEGPDLKSKTEFIENMNWGMNTNFQKVFDKMLEVAVSNKLGEDDMVKRVYVFSDMEFDQASSCPWETDYEAIQRKFKSQGYVNVPEIVFWNLRDSRATPVTANQKGVALLSGFSKNLLTLFLEGGGMINPEDVPKRSGLNPVEIMDAAISGELYQKLVVTVLGHQAIGGFVTHCGWNSLLESLWFGVPSAAWPIYAEQHMNAFEMVVELGLAVENKLDYKKNMYDRSADKDHIDIVTADEIQSGIRRLMEDKEVRTKVKEISEKCRATVVEGGSSRLYDIWGFRVVCEISVCFEIKIMKIGYSERQAQINVAEGKKTSVMLETQAQAEAILVKAQATNNGLELVSQSIKENGGAEAASMHVAERYIDAFGKLAKESTTFLLPANASNPASIVAQALSIFKILNGQDTAKTPPIQVNNRFQK
ncbi:hypothetical protein CTI12_AA303890 [Artemisia annua]|uniref:Uncharacterized protein n=1 Tax=Artemisia annua TaxID=35608 RepID=A0A2U1N541_ARTAN|nr:hypothetical protein CTI12_AA303890 [Artemisia annua]